MGDAPATGSDFFILTFKSLGVSEPADNSVTSAKIVDGAIVNADINASAAIAGTKISPNFGSQNIQTTGQVFSSYATLTAVNPTLTFTDSDNNPDYTINVNSGVLKITDSTNSADRVVVNSDGHVDIGGNLDVGAGLDVTGNITGTGDLTLSSGGTDRLKMTHVAGGQFAIKNPSAASLTFGTNNQDNELVIANGGNIGINDTAPSYPLNVIGDNAASNGTGMLKGIIGVQNDTTAFGSNPTAGISFQTKYRTGPDVPLDVAAIFGGKENTTNGDKDGYMGFATREEGGSGNQERMRITSVGRVAIGTDTPLASLHVKSPDGSNARLILEQTQDAANYQNGIDFKNAGTQYAGIVAGKDGSNNSFGLKFHTGSSFTERFQIKDNGHIKITSGNLEFANGSGIDFSAVPDGSRSVTTDGNKLDDYEAGTWTPYFQGSSTHPTQSYVTQNGTYVKVGNLVHCEFDLQMASSGISAGSGFLLVAGIPFQKDSVLQTYGIPASFGYTVNLGSNNPTDAYMASSTSYIYLMNRHVDAGASYSSASAVGNSTRVLGGFSFRTHQ